MQSQDCDMLDSFVRYVGNLRAVTHMYSETLSTPTSGLTPTYVPTVLCAGEMILDPREAQRASMPNWNVIQHLYGVDQFRGFSGSL